MLLPDIDVFSSKFNLSTFQHICKPSSTLYDIRNEYLAETHGQPQLDSRDHTASDSPLTCAESVAGLLLPQSVDGSIESRYGREIKIILPPKHTALKLVETVWGSACVLFRFYHRPSFLKDFDSLYEMDPEEYTDKQNKVLPLVYSVMAVGVLFSTDKRKGNNTIDSTEGYKYFVAARKLIDITDAKDIYAIQTIVMLIIFLQCSARLSTCYSYIGVGLRSALREGLHRKLNHRFNLIELEVRKRIFWTIRKMDIYVNSMLGLPRSIAEEDFDQDMPIELDDENITETEYLPQEPGKISSAAIANAHTRLITILSHIIANIYPIKLNKGKHTSNANIFHTAHFKVSAMENELREWLISLPDELKPRANRDDRYYKANRLLHMAFCYVQIVLYRPFIHYCSPRYQSSAFNNKAKACAENCLKVARTVVYLAEELLNKEMLDGPYWFSVYSLFFSVACLVYYVHENGATKRSLDIKRDAEIGRDVLNTLKDTSSASIRTHTILNNLFEQLNRRTAKIPVSEAQQQHEQQNQQNHQQQQSQSIANDINNHLGKIYDTPRRHYVTTMEPTEFSNNGTPLTTGSLDFQPEELTGSLNLYKPDPNNNVNSYFRNHSDNNSPGVNSDSTYRPPLHTSHSYSTIKSESQNDLTTPKSAQSQTYAPGIMDQLEIQVLGRFLPPYMLERNGSSNHDIYNDLLDNPTSRTATDPLNYDFGFGELRGTDSTTGAVNDHNSRKPSDHNRHMNNPSTSSTVTSISSNINSHDVNGASNNSWDNYLHES